MKMKRILEKISKINYSVNITSWLSIWGGFYSGEAGICTIGIQSDHGDDYWWVNLEIRIWKITFIGIFITHE